MDIEKHLDYLSNNLLQIHELIINIEHCGMDNDDKKKTLLILNEKYLKIQKVFQHKILTYCSM